MRLRRIGLVFLLLLACQSAWAVGIELPEKLLQCDYPWGDKALGYSTRSDYTVCEMGCYLTCVSMLLRYYGVNVDPHGSMVTPLTLNEWLKNHDGYDYEDVCDENGLRRKVACVKREKVAVFCAMAAARNGGAMVSIRSLRRVSRWQDHLDDQLVSTEVLAGRPVFLRVNSIDSHGAIKPDSHWVILVEWTAMPIGMDWLRVADPAAPTLDYCSLEARPYLDTWQGRDLWRGSPPAAAGQCSAATTGIPDLGLLGIHSATDVRVLVTDPLGRRAGSDASGNDYNEIPASSATNGIIASGGSSNTSRLLLVSLAEGDYTLQTSGQVGTAFDVNLERVDFDGNCASEIISGSIPASGSTSAVVPVAEKMTTGYLKRLGPSFADLVARNVTSGSSDRPGLYIGETNRSGGIKVVPVPGDPDLPYNVGDVLNVAGSITVVDGEARLEATDISVVSRSSAQVIPVGMSQPSIGGVGLGIQPGVNGGRGPNNIGLLVRTAGRITCADPGGQFITVSDGSSRTDPNGNPGVRIRTFFTTPPYVGDFAIVTGIVSLTNSGGVYYPVIVTRQQSDVQIMAAGSMTGRITTAGGVPAVGVTVTAAPGGATAITNGVGDYAIGGLRSGSYAVTPTQAGYTFVPSSRSVTVADGAASTGIDFTRQAGPGKSIKGTVVRRNIVQVAQTVQSSHPYPQNANDVQTVTGPTGAIAIAAHFPMVSLEPGHAFLRVRDYAGTLFQTFDQAYCASTWSSWVPGNVLQLSLTSDYSIWHYGYQMDRYRALMDGGPASGVLLTLMPGGRTCTTGPDGRYEFEGVSPGSYTVAASETNHLFEPASSAMSMGSSDVTGVDFAAFEYGGISGRVQSGAVQECSVVPPVESPHSYQDIYPDLRGVDVGPPVYAAIRAHFTQIDMAPTSDYLFVEDAGAKFFQDITGSGRLDVWSDWVPGNQIRFRLLSDLAGNGYGYLVDKVQVQFSSGMASGVTLTLTPGGLTAVAGADGTYSFGSVPPGAYTVTPSQSGYSFEPASRQIVVEVGTVAGTVDFLRK